MSVAVRKSIINIFEILEFLAGAVVFSVIFAFVMLGTFGYFLWDMRKEMWHSLKVPPMPKV